MPPDWPDNDLSEEDIGFAALTWDWDVSKEDVLEVLRVPKHWLDTIEYGKRHARLAGLYGSRSTIATGITYAGTRVEIGLRFDNNGVSDHECLVFHANYV